MENRPIRLGGRYVRSSRCLWGPVASVPTCPSRLNVFGSSSHLPGRRGCEEDTRSLERCLGIVNAWGPDSRPEGAGSTSLKRLEITGGLVSRFPLPWLPAAAWDPDPNLFSPLPFGFLASCPVFTSGRRGPYPSLWLDCGTDGGRDHHDWVHRGADGGSCRIGTRLLS